MHCDKGKGEWCGKQDTFASIKVEKGYYITIGEHNLPREEPLDQNYYLGRVMSFVGPIEVPDL